MVDKWDKKSLRNALETCLRTSKRMCMTMDCEMVDWDLSIQYVICFWVIHRILKKTDPSLYSKKITAVPLSQLLRCPNATLFGTIPTHHSPFRLWILTSWSWLPYKNFIFCIQLALLASTLFFIMSLYLFKSELQRYEQTNVSFNSHALEWQT